MGIVASVYLVAYWYFCKSKPELASRLHDSWIGIPFFVVYVGCILLVVAMALKGIFEGFPG